MRYQANPFAPATAIAGWLAGVHAYRSLRTEPFALPWYVIAGALPGMILLASEALTTFGGTSLVSLVHGFSSGDAPSADLSSYARVRDALIVLGVGSFVSLVGGARAIRESKRESALG